MITMASKMGTSGDSDNFGTTDENPEDFDYETEIHDENLKPRHPMIQRLSTGIHKVMKDPMQCSGYEDDFTFSAKPLLEGRRPLPPDLASQPTQASPKTRSKSSSALVNTASAQRAYSQPLVENHRISLQQLRCTVDHVPRTDHVTSRPDVNGLRGASLGAEGSNQDGGTGGMVSSYSESSLIQLLNGDSFQIGGHRDRMEDLSEVFVDQAKASPATPVDLVIDSQPPTRCTDCHLHRSWILVLKLGHVLPVAYSNLMDFGDGGIPPTVETWKELFCIRNALCNRQGNSASALADGGNPLCVECKGLYHNWFRRPYLCDLEPPVKQSSSHQLASSSRNRKSSADNPSPLDRLLSTHTSLFCDVKTSTKSTSLTSTIEPSKSSSDDATSPLGYCSRDRLSEGRICNGITEQESRLGAKTESRMAEKSRMGDNFAKSVPSNQTEDSTSCDTGQMSVSMYYNPAYQSVICAENMDIDDIGRLQQLTWCWLADVSLEWLLTVMLMVVGVEPVLNMLEEPEWESVHLEDCFWQRVQLGCHRFWKTFTIPETAWQKLLDLAVCPSLTQEAFIQAALGEINALMGPPVQIDLATGICRTCTLPLRSKVSETKLDVIVYMSCGHAFHEVCVPANQRCCLVCHFDTI